MLDLIKQDIYHFFLSLFYPKDWVIVCEDQMFCFFSEFINIASILFYNFIEFIILLYTSFSQYKQYMICLIIFNTFSHVLPAFTCASTIGNLWSICLGVDILIPLTFCYLLKSRIFSIISTTFFRFSFSGISFLLILFLKSISPLLTLFTNFSFLFCLALIKCFTKSDGFWYLRIQWRLIFAIVIRCYRLRL